MALMHARFLLGFTIDTGADPDFGFGGVMVRAHPKIHFEEAPTQKKCFRIFGLRQKLKFL